MRIDINFACLDAFVYDAEQGMCQAVFFVWTGGGELSGDKACSKAVNNNYLIYYTLFDRVLLGRASNKKLAGEKLSVLIREVAWQKGATSVDWVSDTSKRNL